MDNIEDSTAFRDLITATSATNSLIVQSNFFNIRFLKYASKSLRCAHLASSVSSLSKVVFSWMHHEIKMIHVCLSASVNSQASF